MSLALPWPWLLCPALPVPALPCLCLPVEDLLAAALRLGALERAGLKALLDPSMPVSDSESDTMMLCPERAWVRLVCFFKRLHPAVANESLQLHILVHICVYYMYYCIIRPMGQTKDILDTLSDAIQQVNEAVKQYFDQLSQPSTREAICQSTIESNPHGDEKHGLHEQHKPRRKQQL